MIEAEWWEYDSLDELADAAAGDISFIIDSAVDARGSSLVAFPAARPARRSSPSLPVRKLDWRKVTIIPTDERLVPMEDERSNIRSIAKTFLPRERGSFRSQPTSPTIALRAIPPMPGCRICPGRRIWSGSAWARTVTPRRSSPGRTCRMRSMRPRRGGPSG